MVLARVNVLYLRLGQALPWTHEHFCKSCILLKRNPQFLGNDLGTLDRTRDRARPDRFDTLVKEQSSQRENLPPATSIKAFVIAAGITPIAVRLSFPMTDKIGGFQLSIGGHHGEDAPAGSAWKFAKHC